jgi:hypothetical protein
MPKAFRTRAWQAFALCLLGLLAYIVYELQLQYTNAYAGFQPLEYRPLRVLVTAGLCVVLGFSLPAQITKPSQLFLIIYATFVLLSYILFAGAAREEHLGTYLFWLSLLAVPYFVMHGLSMANWSLAIGFDLRRETVLMIAVGIVGAGVFMAVLNTGQSGGLSIADAYDRRMVGRDVFEAGSLMAYLNVMSMNGVNPFLAFLGGLLNRKLFALLSLLFSTVFFYSIGVKAPIAYAGMAYFVGLGVRSGRLRVFFDAVVVISALLFVGFLIEYSLNNGYSEIAEYFHRRIFVIPGFDVQHYMDLIFQSGDALWSPWRGVNSDLDTTYLVGALFFGNVQANVNTNAFTLALASGGVPGYLLIIALVGAFLKALDALYAASGNAGYLYLGFLYSILLTEQGATTALASSGVALLFIILMLSGKGWTQADVARSALRTPELRRAS